MMKMARKKEGENIGHVPAHPGLHLQTLACIGLCKKVFPAPTPFAHCEQQEDQRAHRQDDVADQEVLQVHEVAGTAKGVNPREQVEAQRAGHGEHQHDQAIDQAGLFRLQPNRSMQQARMVSKTAKTVVKAAKVIKTKNSAPTDSPETCG